MGRRGPSPEDIAKRFWRQVDRTGDCWLWLGAVKRDGYGAFSATGRKQVRAHRMALMLELGMFDRRLLVLHKCDTPLCVRPDHLYLGDQAQNMRDRAKRRDVSLWNHEARKTHCANGHEFTADNTHIRADKFQRVCRACNREAQKRRRNGYGT